MQRSDYAWAPLAYAQYTAIITSGEFPHTVSPMLNRADYDSLIAVMQPGNVNPRLPLAFTWAEGHDGTDTGLVAARVNNLGGIKYSGAAGTYDSGIPADTGGTYAGFPDLSFYWREWLRIMDNSIIGPDFTSGNLIGAVEHYTNGPGTGHNKVDKYLEYVADYPAQGGAVSTTAGVTGAAVVAAAMAHLGQGTERDTWNGDHPVYYMCQADVEDWVWEATGIVPVHYPTAAAAGDAAPLNNGIAPAGAQVFFRGPAWSVYDHTGVALGDGRTISGLQTVTISDGWQDPSQGYRGWRMPVGVSVDATPDAPPQPPVDPFFIDGNPCGAVPVKAPFWSRWDALNTMGVPLDHPGAVNPTGLALPQIGYAVEAETLYGTRRVQHFERVWLGEGDGPAPFDVVVLTPTDVANMTAATIGTSGAQPPRH